MTEERPHAELSSSKIDIALNCSGSVVLAREVPAKDPTEAMLSGTKTHDISEKILEEFLEHKISGSPNPLLTLSLEGDIEREERVKGYVEAIYEKLFEGSVSNKAYAIEDKLVIHKEFDIYGYADIWNVYRDDRARKAGAIADLKDGQVAVSAKTNQLKFLALGLLEEFRRKGVELDYIRAGIYQSRAPDDKQYTEVKYTAKQLDTFKAKVLKLAESIYLKKKVRFKTGSHCRYCKAQQICPTYARSLENTTALTLLEPSEIKFPEPQTIPDNVLRNIVLQAGAIEDFVAACKKYATSRIVNAKPIDGLKLVEGSTKRRIDKTKELEIGEFFTSHGIDPFDKKLKGIGKLSIELKRKGLSKELVDSFCTSGVKPIILVDKTDPRPEVSNPMDLLKQQTIEDTENDT